MEQHIWIAAQTSAFEGDRFIGAYRDREGAKGGCHTDLNAGRNVTERVLECAWDDAPYGGDHNISVDDEWDYKVFRTQVQP